MSAQKPKKRRFWQLHLSTLIAGSLGIGVFFTLNLQVRESIGWGSEGILDREDYFGWPVWACEHYRRYKYDGIDEGDKLDEDRYYVDWPLSSSWARHTVYFETEGISPWWKSPFIIDVLVNCLLLVVVIFLCEWFIRRLEGRKK